MVATTENPERLEQTRKHLNALYAMGYRYLVTTDDGESWIGSAQHGLEIDELLLTGFVGRVSLDEPH